MAAGHRSGAAKQEGNPQEINRTTSAQTGERTGSTGENLKKNGFNNGFICMSN